MGLEEAAMNQAPVGLENGADRAASSRENPVLFPAPAKSLENIEFSGLFLCLFALITLYSSIAYPLTVQA